MVTRLQFVSKSTMRIIILMIITIVGICKTAKGQVTTLAIFNFESSNLLPLAGAIGSPVLTGSASVSYFDGSTTSSTASACFAFANTKYFELTIATTGYQTSYL